MRKKKIVMTGKRVFLSSLAMLLVMFVLAAMAQHKHDMEATSATEQQPAAASGSPAEAGMGDGMAGMNDAMSAMSSHGHGDEGPGHHHAMGPHMKMSTLRNNAQPGDAEKANQIVAVARETLEKYRDSKAAEADGYKIFMPQMKHQKQYHFTNWKYAMEAGFTFNAAHPTSLLYEKVGGDASDKFRLIGAMYTAPARYSEDQLNARVPLSVAQWHQHVNLCMPPKGHEREALPDASGKAKFGLAGSISTEEACTAAGGTFKPRIFGWMVHVYPDEKTSDGIWSVERQMTASK